MNPQYTHLKAKTPQEMGDSLMNMKLYDLLYKIHIAFRAGGKERNDIYNILENVSDEQWYTKFVNSEKQNTTYCDSFVVFLVIPKKLYKTFKFLLHYGMIEISGDYIMNNIIKSNNMRLIKMLLEDPRSKPHKSSAMAEAINNNNIKVVKMLLEDPRVKSNNMEIRNAAYDNNLEIIKVLLDAGYTISDSQLLELAESHKFKILSEIIKLDAVPIEEKTLKTIKWLLAKWQTKRKYILGESYIPTIMKAKTVNEALFTYLQPKSPEDMKKQLVGMNFEQKLKMIQRMGSEFPQLFKGLQDDPNIDDETNQLLLLMKIKNAMKDNKLEDVQTLIEQLGDKYGKETLLDQAKHTLFTSKEAEQLKISLYKHQRNEQELERDELYNLYAFMGFSDDIEREVNGETLYKKELGIENLVKIDKYNVNDLNAINMMKARSRIQYPNDSKAGVFCVYVPNEWIDEDSYQKSDLNDMTFQWIDEHKFKL